MSTKAGDKRHNKKVFQVEKKCLWCEEIIEIGTRSPAQYNKINTHAGCVTNWRHYRMARRLAEEINDRGEVKCEKCDAVMTRRPDELLQSWIKRRFCNKSCAAARRPGTRAKPSIISAETIEEVRLHVKRYIPGTPEFQRVAAMYGG